MTLGTFVVRADEPVDFHLHTDASDGRWTPRQLVDHLAARGFRAAAICDHDTMRSVAEAMEYGAALGICIVPGVEVTTFWGGRQWHLLVYNADPASERGHGFGALLARQQDALAAAAERGIIALESHGYALPSLAEVVNGRPLLPVHVLQAAIKDGHATNLQTAHQLVKRFGETLRVDVPLEETVRLAHAAGGICILAHPGRDDGDGRLDADLLDRMLRTIPLDGLEGHYRSYSEDDTARYRDMAVERGLLISAGSDSHAPGFPVDPRPYPARWVVPFLERLGLDPADFDGQGWYRGADVVLQTPQAP
ncbi:MAG: PHP domain-containing protein [Sphaerobacter sp.]|nr:PHP domain-containing protein [Sphaerobacter sp.]